MDSNHPRRLYESRVLPTELASRVFPQTWLPNRSAVATRFGLAPASRFAPQVHRMARGVKAHRIFRSGVHYKGRPPLMRPGEAHSQFHRLAADFSGSLPTRDRLSLGGCGLVGDCQGPVEPRTPLKDHKTRGGCLPLRPKLRTLLPWGVTLIFTTKFRLNAYSQRRRGLGKGTAFESPSPAAL